MQTHFNSLTDGATLRTIGMPDLRAFAIPLPPVEEQLAICEYAAAQTAKADALIAKTERFIELSRERRAALITAAVTGQIDVQEVPR
jgi:type I restriction enzyme S subunit